MSQIAFVLLTLVLLTGACTSTALNAKREELKVPERQPLWVNEGGVSAIEVFGTIAAIRDKTAERYVNLQTGDRVETSSRPPDVEFWQPKKSALPFDEPSIERLGLYGSRVLATGSKKPEGSKTSYGLVASDSKSAAIVWTHFAAAPLCKLSFPVIASERVYFVEEAEYKKGEEVHTVLALDLTTGKKVWSQPLKGRDQFFGFIEAVSDGKVWVRNYGVAGAAANYRILEAATGNPVGDVAMPVEYKSVVIHGGILYGVDRWAHSLVNEAGTTTPDSYLVAVNAMTGAPLWKSPKQELCELGKTVVTTDGTVLVARYPVVGAKEKEGVLAFRGGR